MDKNFNKLTPAEAERLAYLIEEASEVIHIACKVLRHGYNNYNPDGPGSLDNRALLETEIADFIKALELMTKKKDILTESIDGRAKQKTYKYMHHQGE